MTPITITGKEYPWPEGCRWFQSVDNEYGSGGKFDPPCPSQWCPYFPPHPDSQISLFDRWLPIIAAVAARHFRNKQTKLVNEIEEVAFGIQAINGCDWSRHTELHELLTYCGNAAEQWEQLCHDL